MIHANPILIVEDNPLNLKLASMYMKKLGLKYDVALNAETALTMFKKNDYDIILMDIELPEMSGIEASRKIRQIEACKSNSGKHVKIIAITAHHHSAINEEHYKALDQIAHKPLRLKDYQKLLNN